MKNEIKRDRFVRVAQKRVCKVLENLDALGNCANTTNYSYTQTEAHKIFEAITTKVDEIEKLFAGQGKQLQFKLAKKKDTPSKTPKKHTAIA